MWRVTISQESHHRRAPSPTPSRSTVLSKRSNWLERGWDRGPVLQVTVTGRALQKIASDRQSAKPKTCVEALLLKLACIKLSFHSNHEHASSCPSRFFCTTPIPFRHLPLLRSTLPVLCCSPIDAYVLRNEGPRRLPHGHNMDTTWS